jgi:hypothetical protein
MRDRAGKLRQQRVETRLRLCVRQASGFVSQPHEQANARLGPVDDGANHVHKSEGRHPALIGAALMERLKRDEVFRGKRSTDADFGQHARLDRIEFAMVAQIFDDPRFFRARRIFELQQRRNTVFEKQRRKARIQGMRDLVKRVRPASRVCARSFYR